MPLLIARTVLAIACVFATVIQAQDTKPAAPASQAASISPDAQKLLDQVRTAYSKLKSLELSGNLEFAIDVSGEQKAYGAEFTAMFSAPNKFRHEMKDDVLLISDGVKAYAFSPGIGAYTAGDIEKGSRDLGKLPSPTVELLNTQNPSLELALADDATKILTAGKGAMTTTQAKVDGKDLPALTFKMDEQTITAVIDPSTHLVKQWQVDLSKALAAKGAQDVKKALITINYTQIEADTNIVDTQFAFTPPQEARVAKAQDFGKQDAAMELVGKPAPDFKLKGMDDKEVTLASLKGNVVVLDFWATWCGPCVAGFPHIDALAKKYAAQGVKVFGMNQKEDKETIDNFLKEKNLTVPVLLDPGEIADKYQVKGIPQTVIIGKDGLIKHVHIGYGPGEENEWDKEVQDALK
jgi:peroxiredoxin/outer membrane lipoprotein-sorting protein